MRILPIMTLAAGLPLIVASAAGAQSMPQSSGAMPGTNMNAKCPADDPEVVLDKAAKTYTLAPSAKTPRGSRPALSDESGENPGHAAIAASRNSAATATLVDVCKSDADKMGAHMSSNSTNPNKK